MIGFHFQLPVQDWPRAVAQLPAGTPVKAVDRADILREAKRVNPGILTVLRHWYDQGQTFDGAPYPTLINRATQFFASFIDGTFMEQYAPYVDVVETWNETLANSQTSEEKQMRVDQCRAFCEVWAQNYAHLYPHIKLCLVNAAVGNDIPLGMAQLAAQYGHYMGYHPYIGVKNGVVEWGGLESFLSLRHMQMDARYTASGYNVKWLFTEGGPVRDIGGGALDPQGGWRHAGVCNGDRVKYVNIMTEWARRVKDWNQGNDNRARGVTLFTSYNQNDQQWKWFHTAQPEMDMLAQVARQFPPGEPGGINPPPEDWQHAAWDKSVELQTISLNPNAALQRAIYADGFVPVESEFSLDGRALQAAEHLQTGERRVYYAVIPNWSDVRWFGEPNEAGHVLAVDVSEHQGEIDVPKLQAKMRAAQ